MTPGGILETTLYAKDLDAIERFYKGVLGLPVVAREAGHHVFFRCGPGLLVVTNPAGSSRPPPMGAPLPPPRHQPPAPPHPARRP